MCLWLIEAHSLELWSHKKDANCRKVYKFKYVKWFQQLPATTTKLWPQFLHIKLVQHLKLCIPFLHRKATQQCALNTENRAHEDYSKNK